MTYARILPLASILISTLWIASLFINIPVYGERPVFVDGYVSIKRGSSRIEAVRILVYEDSMNREYIETLYTVKLTFTQRPQLSSIVEHTFVEIYSARVKPFFNTLSVMYEDEFRNGVQSVLDRLGILIRSQEISGNEEEIRVQLRDQFLVVIVRYVLRNIEVDLSNHVPSAIYYGRETPRENNLYAYVFRARNDSFYSILLRYFVENAIVSNSHIDVRYYISISKGSISYSGVVLSWIVTIVLTAARPEFFKRLPYMLRTLIRNLKEISQRLGIGTLLSKTPSPRRDKRS